MRTAMGTGAGPKVRDRICQVIRQHKLDPELVKACAVDFCGAKTLREATREQVENFVQHLGDWAEKDRDALLCRLNSYLGAHPVIPPSQNPLRDGNVYFASPKFAPLLARPLSIQRLQGAALAHIRMFHFTFDQPSVGLR